MIVFLLLGALSVAAGEILYRSDYTYHERAGGWFKVHKIPATWDEARVRCNLEGAVLASPINVNVTSALTELTKEAGLDLECGMFTGTNARYSKGDYYSIEGVPLSRMPVEWMPSEPDNYNNEEECIVMVGNGSIADANCSMVMPYVCYKKADKTVPVNKCGTSDNDGSHYRFDYSYHERAGGWFKVHKIPATWDEAKVRCDLEGAVLASPINVNVTSALTELTKEAGLDLECGMFTGTNARHSKGDFYSIEGVPLSRMPVEWMPSEPDNYNNNEECIVMVGNGSIADANCSMVMPYVCYKKAGKIVPVNECGTSDNGYKLFPKTGNCYKFHTEVRNWSSAFMACSAEGGYLAIPNDKEEAMHLRDLFRENLNFNCYIHSVILLGFLDINRDGVWTTIHGSRLEDNYARWGQNEPNHLQNAQFCGAMFQDGELDDFWCRELAPFVCEKTVDSLI